MRWRRSRRPGFSTENTLVSADGPRPASGGRAALLAAVLSFAYSLVITVALLLLRDFFSDEDNQQTVLLWLTVPIIASFFTWMVVQWSRPYLRIVIWVFVLATLFFCWISIFTVGLYYIPVAAMMVMAALGPWSGDGAQQQSPEENP